MTRTAYFDPFSGASGDMTVGALLDAGASLDDVRRAILSTGVEGVSLRSERVERGGFAATRFVVELEGRHAHEHAGGHGHDHGHEHDEAGAHAHDHEHKPKSRQASKGAKKGKREGDHAHSRARAGAPSGDGGHHHRGLTEILAMIARAELSQRGKDRASAVFRVLAEAEGRVHGRPPESVHFHEVGAADSIADVVGAAAALESLGIEAVASGIPALGCDGFITCAHGRLPLPAPAVVEILKGRPVKPGLSGVEQTTPTGAALLAGLAPAFGPAPEMTLEKVGYGAGGRDDHRAPNVLRVLIGSSGAAGSGDAASGEGRVLEITATLDNVSGEVLGYLFERLPAEGALEVSLLPATLKKSRQGVHLVVLAPEPRLGAIARTIFRETPTLGLRHRPVSRITLERRFEEVVTPWGAVKVKCGLLDNELVTASPEYEDCRKLAAESGAPLRDVQAEAVRAFAAKQRGN